MSQEKLALKESTGGAGERASLLWRVDVTRPAPAEVPAPSEEASNATEATKEATADTTTATAEAEAPAPTEGTSARQVNWTLMHGWE